MIVIRSALSQDKIIALVNSLSYGEVPFSYQEKKAFNDCLRLRVLGWI